MWFGVEKSDKKLSNQKKIEALIAQVTILPITEETALHYGVIKNSLKQRAGQFRENDIWIAATAKEYDITLVTRDDHFLAIDGIKLEAW